MDYWNVRSDRTLGALDEGATDAGLSRAKWLTPQREAQRYWSGVIGSTWWFYFTGPASDEAWSAYLAHVRAMLDSGVARPALLCLAHRAAPPTAEHRRWITDFITTEQARLSSLAGFALVTDSPLHVLTLKAISWVVKKPYPEKVCGSPITAARWLAEQGADLDENALLASLTRTVPPEHMWIDL